MCRDSVNGCCLWVCVETFIGFEHSLCPLLSVYCFCSLTTRHEVRSLSAVPHSVQSGGGPLVPCPATGRSSEGEEGDTTTYQWYVRTRVRTRASVYPRAAQPVLRGALPGVGMRLQPSRLCGMRWWSSCPLVN